MKTKHWQSPALQKLKFSKLKMLQTTPGFAGENLTNVSAGRESNTQHATRNHFCHLDLSIFVAL